MIGMFGRIKRLIQAVKIGHKHLLRELGGRKLRRLEGMLTCSVLLWATLNRCLIWSLLPYIVLMALNEYELS